MKSPLTLSRALLAALASVTLLTALASPVLAHLALIRQGAESRGSREPGDSMGRALAAGDFNGDGYDDLASAAPGEALGSLSDAGAVIVNWGTAFGLTHAGSLLFTPESLGGSDEADGRFGYALAAGDFNGDGEDDLAIGQPGYDLGGGVQDIGHVWIVIGHPSAFGGTVITRFQSDAGGSNEAGDEFGAALATGDFNGDGYDDLAVGAPGEDAGAGAVFQFLGSVFGPIVDGGWFKQSTLGGANDPGDRFGSALAAGDLTGLGGYDELIVGAPFSDAGHLQDAGAVWVLRGSSNGLTATSPIPVNASVGGSIEAAARFGSALACGTFWGGVYDGLAVGEPYRTVDGKAAAGRVYVAQGGFTGLDWTDDGLVLDQSDAGETVDAHDHFGQELAAGHFDVHAESHEDLFVGAPGEGAGAVAAGWIGILYGGANGPDGSAWGGFYQSTLNDAITGGEQLGSAIACGKFDASGHGNLAVGAPGDNSFTGMVHVIAPWRQAFNLSSVRAVSFDCEGNRIFSVKPFEETKIASTTKIMTVLIACERALLPPGDPRRVPLSTEYEVPSWMLQSVPGSQYGFRYRERITLGQLLYACLYPSGNDAAYAIADLLTGGGESWTGITTTCTEFVQEMNDRAAALGMDRTHFTNPAGLDAGDPYSTADDMMKLARAAMGNFLFAQVASDGSFTWTRRWQDANSNPWIESWTQNYGWLANLRSAVPEANGLKPGWTPGAQGTACMSVESPGGANAYAGMFGVPDGDPDYYSDARKLLDLGAEECEWDLAFGQLPEFTMYLPGLPTVLSNYAGGGQTIEDGGSAVRLELHRQSGEGNTAARFEVRHDVDAWFGGAESATFGIGPFQEHGEIVIRNAGDTPAVLRVQRSAGGGPLDLVLQPGDGSVIPAYVSPQPLSQFTLTIENRTGDIAALPVWLTIQETYGFELESIGAGSGPQFSADLRTPSVARTENLSVRVAGRDPNPGSTLYFSAREAGAPSSAGDPGIGADGGPGAGDGSDTGEDAGADGSAAVTQIRVGPNPFLERTSIEFRLARPAAVELMLYDAQGREVRRYVEPAVPAGRWAATWDGRDHQGAELPGGVYFYRLAVDARPAAEGKIVRTR